MILQALHYYFDVLDSRGDAPPMGYSLENVGFLLEIDSEGRLITDIDFRQGGGKQLRPRRIPIPYSNPVNVRSSNVQPNFLVDKADYLLGYSPKAKKLEEKHRRFKEMLSKVAKGIVDPDFAAVLKFYKLWNPADTPSKLEYAGEMTSGNAGFIAFKLVGKNELVHERVPVQQAWAEYLSSERYVLGNCLVTGETGPIQDLHSQFKGLRGGQSSGKSLVSFNASAFTSYHKESALNSPVTVKAEFRASTSLKYLIQSDSHKLYINDIAVLFWAERESPVEGFFGAALNPSDTSAEDQQLSLYLQAVKQGRLPQGIDPGVRFYILGLSPNAARIAVRFWHASTVGEISQRIGQHFRDLEMIRSFDNEPEHPGMWQLLRETTNSRSKEPPAPLLGGAIMRAIINGTPYPRSLLSAVLGRIRAEQAQDKSNVNYIRAAIIRAVLARQYRITGKNTEVPSVLDKTNTTPAYLLGRLFAVLEKLQQNAIHNANATIRDRFYGAASATPRAVFPQLLRLAQHHISKAEYGGIRDREIEEIMAELPSFPAHLNTDGQGLFAIGYYQQRQAFYAKKTNETEDKEQ